MLHRRSSANFQPKRKSIRAQKHHHNLRISTCQRKTKFVESQGFANGDDELRQTFAQIASDGCRTFETENGLPGMDVVSTCGELSLDITHINLYLKQMNIISAERYTHINSLKNALKKVEQEKQGIFRNLR